MTLSFIRTSDQCRNWSFWCETAIKFSSQKYYQKLYIFICCKLYFLQTKKNLNDLELWIIILKEEKNHPWIFALSGRSSSLNSILCTISLSPMFNRWVTWVSEQVCSSWQRHRFRLQDQYLMRIISSF